MDLLVAYKNDPAGNNMAEFLSQDLEKKNGVFRGEKFDVLITTSPVISADWLEEKFDYDGYVFLSKHAAESGTLALTCHSTGNFDVAKFGGNSQQVAIPFPSFQKIYLQNLWKNRTDFPDFQITIEATHHGPTDLNKPSIFIEIGTTQKQWNDVELCNSIAQIVEKTFKEPLQQFPFAVCFGGTHYSQKFTNEIINGKFALGTVIPKHALEFLNESLFQHIIERNIGAQVALLDWNSLGKNKQKVVELLSTTKLEVIKI
jgi:D-aminoacyl-tRNA deacylase